MGLGAVLYRSNIGYIFISCTLAVQIRVKAQGDDHYMQRAFESLVAENQQMRAAVHSLMIEHNLLLSRLELMQATQMQTTQMQTTQMQTMQTLLLLNCNNIPSNDRRTPNAGDRDDSIIKEQVRNLLLRDEIRQDADPSQLSMDVQIDDLEDAKSEFSLKALWFIAWPG